MCNFRQREHECVTVVRKKNLSVYFCQTEEPQSIILVNEILNVLFRKNNLSV